MQRSKICATKVVLWLKIGQIKWGGVLKTVGEELKKQLPQIVIRTIAILSIFLVSQNSVKDYNKEEFKIFMQIVWLVSMIEPLTRVGDQSILKIGSSSASEENLEPANDSVIQRQEGELTEFQKQMISEAIDRGFERAKFNQKVKNIKRFLTLVITIQPHPNHPLTQQLEIERELLKLSGMDDTNSEPSFNINQARGISVLAEDYDIESPVSELTEMLESEFIDSDSEEILKIYLGIMNSTLTQEGLDKFIENHPEIIIPLEQG